MKTIAILGCFDTKESELRYVAKEIEEQGLKTLMIDVSTSAGFYVDADYINSDVSQEVGVSWSEVEGSEQQTLLDIMARGSKSLIAGLYSRGEINGIFSCGGLQNTTIASSAMKGLPIGFPKLIVSTVASGQRTFDSIVGTKDIVTMPSISDFTGLTSISRTVLDNAVAALVGMVKHAGREIPKKNSVLIGATLMGATNDGVENAIRKVIDENYEVVSFHSTGTGGRVLEELITAGIVTATMDLTLHEIVYEHFGYGFGYGAQNRLTAGVDNKIPMLVCPAGIDFMCQWKENLFDDVDKRKVHWHNKNLAHVKLLEHEVSEIARIIVNRLNRADGNVKVLLPTKGFRSFSRKGETLYDPKSDQLIIDIFCDGLNSAIPVKVVEHNFMDRAFSEIAAHEMISLIKEMSND